VQHDGLCREVWPESKPCRVSNPVVRQKFHERLMAAASTGGSDLYL